MSIRRFFKIVGFVRKRFLSLPSPLPVSLFVCFFCFFFCFVVVVVVVVVVAFTHLFPIFARSNGKKRAKPGHGKAC